MRHLQGQTQVLIASLGYHPQEILKRHEDQGQIYEHLQGIQAFRSSRWGKESHWRSRVTKRNENYHS